MIDINTVRRDFPVLNETIYGNPLVYLDNAATSQMPLTVLQAFHDHYCHSNANVHRGIHYLSEHSTRDYEIAREKLAGWIGANADEVVFTSGTTSSINLAAAALRCSRQDEPAYLQAGDEIIISMHEHHSNFVPWQQLCESAGLTLKIVPYCDGEFDLETYKNMLSEKTKLVAAAHVTNVTGAVNPVNEITRLAHEAGALVLLDGAQGILHAGMDVKKTGCDFYCFSGHKMCGPGGIGVLYISKQVQQYLSPPWFGGGMVDKVTTEESTFEPFPYCFEAGTPNFQGAITLGAAVDYLSAIGRNEITAYEEQLTVYAFDALSSIPGLRIFGNPTTRCSIISFIIEGVHPFDLASLLDKCGVAVRSGTLCAQPALSDFGVSFCTRASFAFYNYLREIDILCTSIEKALHILKKH